LKWVKNGIRALDDVLGGSTRIAGSDPERREAAAREGEVQGRTE
jgi:hypothetical protein